LSKSVSAKRECAVLVILMSSVSVMALCVYNLENGKLGIFLCTCDKELTLRLIFEKMKRD